MARGNLSCPIITGEVVEPWVHVEVIKIDQAEVVDEQCVNDDAVKGQVDIVRNELTLFPLLL